MCILEDRQHVLSSTFKTLQLNLWDMSFSLSSVLHLNYRLWKQVLKKYVLKIILCIGSGSQPTCASLIFTFMPKVTSERYTLLALIVQFILDLLIASTLARKSLQAIQCSLLLHFAQRYDKFSSFQCHLEHFKWVCSCVDCILWAL